MVEFMTFNEAKSSAMKTVLAHSMERLEWQRDIYKRMHHHPELSGPAMNWINLIARSLPILVAMELSLFFAMAMALAFSCAPISMVCQY